MSGLKQLAIEVGMHYREIEDEFCKANTDGVPMEMLEAFAKLVAAKERERCAFLCDELWRKGGWDHNAGYAADRIRALK